MRNRIVAFSFKSETFDQSFGEKYQIFCIFIFFFRSDSMHREIALYSFTFIYLKKKINLLFVILILSFKSNQSDWRDINGVCLISWIFVEWFFPFKSICQTFLHKCFCLQNAVNDPITWLCQTVVNGNQFLDLLKNWNRCGLRIYFVVLVAKVCFYAGTN